MLKIMTPLLKQNVFSGAFIPQSNKKDLNYRCNYPVVRQDILINITGFQIHSVLLSGSVCFLQVPKVNTLPNNI
jgi:hypothetical protein